jgi:hypothetical protein
MIEIEVPDRDVLRDILLRWQKGDITFAAAVEEAELLEERYSFEVIETPLPVAEPWCVSFIALHEPTKGFVEPLFPEDIPALLEYLDTPTGDEVAASERLWSCLERMGVQDRLARAAREYGWLTG